jgi:protocatechuate 3,4-dioxygenase beta subunit
MLVALLLAGCSAGADLASASPAAEASPVAPALPETQPEPAVAACFAEVTIAQTEGPYYNPGSPERSDLVEPGTAGEALLLTGVVMTPDCSPIAGARLDFWQADGNGD